MACENAARNWARFVWAGLREGAWFDGKGAPYWARAVWAWLEGRGLRMRAWVMLMHNMGALSVGAWLREGAGSMDAGVASAQAWLLREHGWGAWPVDGGVASAQEWFFMGAQAMWAGLGRGRCLRWAWLTVAPPPGAVAGFPA